jgi:drug/metabolite transporter (DMT)-like permease
MQAATLSRRRRYCRHVSSSRDRESERILAGIGLVVVAVACFATLDTATKVSTIGVPILMGLWFRYAFQAVATTLVLLPRYGTAVLRTEHPRFQLLRGALLLASSTLAFLSLRYMPLAEFTSIVLIAPLVVTLLAATALKEEVSRLRWALVAGGFAGTLVILRPGGTGLQLGDPAAAVARRHQRVVPDPHQPAGTDRESRSPCTSTPAGSAR